MRTNARDRIQVDRFRNARSNMLTVPLPIYDSLVVPVRLTKVPGVNFSLMRSPFCLIRSCLKSIGAYFDEGLK